MAYSECWFVLLSLIWKSTLQFCHSFVVYGKPVISGGSQVPPNQHPENPYMERPNGGNNTPDTEVDQAPVGSGVPEIQETERIPRPLSPTKLLPFISNPYRHQSDVDLEALRKKLYNAPRPLKKRSSITEPEGPAGPNIQKLLYQKTTLAAMETTVSEPGYHQPGVVEENKESSNVRPAAATEVLPSADVVNVAPEEIVLEPAALSASTISEFEGEDFVPPPPPPHPAPRPEDSLPAPQGGQAQEQSSSLPPPPPESFLEEFPPYPPPPYPSGGAGPEQESLGEDTFNMEPPEVTGQVTLPPVSSVFYKYFTYVLNVHSFMPSAERSMLLAMMMVVSYLRHTGLLTKATLHVNRGCSRKYVDTA